MTGGSTLRRLQALDARLAPRKRVEHQRIEVTWILVAGRILLGAVWIALGVHERGADRAFNLILGGCWLALAIGSFVSQLRRRRS